MSNRQERPLEPVIDVQGLSKHYGNVAAVQDVSFSVVSGEVFGFLGPNGAGKTTTINMLTGLARADAGAIRVSGIDCSRDPKAAQHLTGIVPDESNLYPELTGFDNLCFCGALYGMRKRARETRARELIKDFGLEAAANRSFAAYSKGMKRKLTIAAGLIHSPSILFLDEPTTGIDVASARSIRRLIARLNQDGTTVFLTTHYIEEAERLCNRIAFIVEGKIIRIDRVATLLREAGARHAVQLVVSEVPWDLERTINRAFPGVRCRVTSPLTLRLEGENPMKLGAPVEFLEKRGLDVLEAKRSRHSLEEVFVEITGIEEELLRDNRDNTQEGEEQ